MCIYCGTPKYRKIYENHFGPIPRDDHGRSYEIHHIDGNKRNNNIDNLSCVSIQEHYDIHYQQGDWAACLIMSNRMKVCPEEKSRLGKLLITQRIKNGDHPSANRTSADFTPEWRARISAAAKGRIPWNKGGSRTEEEKAKMREGHRNREKIQCQHCNKVLDKPNYTRHHGDKCKSSH